MLLFDTYKLIATNNKITSTQLELSNGVSYPQGRMDPNTEIAKTYKTLMSYTKSFNDQLTRLTIDLKSFHDLCGIPFNYEL